MNGPVDLHKSQLASVLPPQFEALCPPPQLLPVENVGHYQALQAAIFLALNPHSAIEWLLAIDIAELSCEMKRYRVLRHRLLSTYRQRAIEAMLRRIDVAASVAEMQRAAEFHISQNALDWQLDERAAHDIEARLASYGFDQHSISMESYIQARELFTLFETLLNSARLRRLVLINEFGRPQNRPKQTRTAARMDEPRCCDGGPHY